LIEFDVYATKYSVFDSFFFIARIDSVSNWAYYKIWKVIIYRQWLVCMHKSVE